MSAASPGARRIRPAPGRILPVAFYRRDTLVVARDLLGCILARREVDGSWTGGRIVETEAYRGEDDPACHAAAGLTPRTEVLYGAPGRAYVYFTYGMHHLLNVVTERRGFPAAVLIRALNPLAGTERMASRRGRSTPRELILLRPALKEFAQRLASVPPLLAAALWHYALGTSTMMSAFERLGRAIPTGIFNGDQVDKYLGQIFSQAGRTNDFRQLTHKLFLVATDLDTGEERRLELSPGKAVSLGTSDHDWAVVWHRR